MGSRNVENSFECDSHSGVSALSRNLEPSFAADPLSPSPPLPFPISSIERMNVASAAFDSDKPRNENESRQRRRGGTPCRSNEQRLRRPPYLPPSVCSLSECVRVWGWEGLAGWLAGRLLTLMLMQHVGRSQLRRKADERGRGKGTGMNPGQRGRKEGGTTPRCVRRARNWRTGRPSCFYTRGCSAAAFFGGLIYHINASQLEKYPRNNLPTLRGNY